MKDKWMLDVIEFITEHNGKIDNIPFNDYFFFNINRFRLGRMMIYKNIQFDNDCKILDVGTPAPFQSLFLNKEHNCEVECLDVDNKEIELHKVKLTKKDIIKDELDDVYDIVIMENILEYLPCNLINLREKIISNINNNGYMLVSFEISKYNNLPLHSRISNYIPNHRKIRNFSYVEANKFCRSVNLFPLDKKILRHAGYSETLIILAQVLT